MGGSEGSNGRRKAPHSEEDIMKGRFLLAAFPFSSLSISVLPQTKTNQGLASQAVVKRSSNGQWEDTGIELDVISPVIGRTGDTVLATLDIHERGSSRVLTLQTMLLRPSYPPFRSKQPTGSQAKRGKLP